MATPHVVGAAALVASANPSWTPAQVRNQLVANATPNVVVNPGSGSPNLLLYVGTGTTPPPPTGCTGTNGTDVSIPDAGSAVDQLDHHLRLRSQRLLDLHRGGEHRAHLPR